MSERVEYSQRRKEQCVHCAAGLPMPIKNGIHLLLTNDGSDWRHLPCTARDPEEEIERLRAELAQAQVDLCAPLDWRKQIPEKIAEWNELRAKLEQAEEDKVRLSTAVCSMGQARIRESLRAEQAEKECDEMWKRYHWRPIGEIHEDYGPCVLINLKDPGYQEMGSNLDTDFDESLWTHFTQITPLTHEEARELLAAQKGATDAE